jgi:carbon storage regulator
MLVLTRKKDEALYIGQDIKIKIISIEGDKVKLGIEAPKHVVIHREEVFEAIKQENNEATKLNINIMQDLLKIMQATDE